MTNAAAPPRAIGVSATHDDDAVVRKAFRRLIPLLFVLYVFAYLDRINIGFAALSMNKELGLSPTMFGMANTIFYLGTCCAKSRAICSWHASAHDAGLAGS